MRTSLALLALAATAFAIPQAVTEDIAPKGKAPKGCTTSYDGQFEVTIFKPGNEKRDVTEVSKFTLSKCDAQLTDNSDHVMVKAFSS
jgi:hypothetical protein